MIRILVQIAINALALWVAASFAPNATPPDNVWSLIIVAVVFGLLNTLVRPILSLITCPAYILTLGLFTFVMNVFILWLVEWVTRIEMWGGFWETLVAGIIVSVVSFVLNMFLFPRSDR